MPFQFAITKDSFIVCAIVIIVALICYGIKAIVNFITGKRVAERWLTIVLSFGLVGFILGSFGLSPMIYGMVGAIKYISGIVISLVP